MQNEKSDETDTGFRNFAAQQQAERAKAYWKLVVEVAKADGTASAKTMKALSEAALYFGKEVSEVEQDMVRFRDLQAIDVPALLAKREEAAKVVKAAWARSAEFTQKAQEEHRKALEAEDEAKNYGGQQILIFNEFNRRDQLLRDLKVGGCPEEFLA